MFKIVFGRGKIIGNVTSSAKMQQK